MKPGKAPDYDAVIAEMVLRGGSDLHECILTMFNRMLHGEFSKNPSVEICSSQLSSNEAKLDMSNYRGITVTPALAKVFAMLLKNRTTNDMEGNNLTPGMSVRIYS